MCVAGGPRCEDKWSIYQRSRDNARRRVARARHALEASGNDAEKTRCAQRRLEEAQRQERAADAKVAEQKHATAQLESLSEVYPASVVNDAKCALRRCLEPGDVLDFSGTTRIVVVKENTVVKFPYNDYGMTQCSREERAYRDHQAGEGIIPMARTEVKTTENGYVYCESARVKPVFFRMTDPQRPDWADLIDCAQVGYTKDGQLVAYDL